MQARINEGPSQSGALHASLHQQPHIGRGGPRLHPQLDAYPGILGGPLCWLRWLLATGERVLPPPTGSNRLLRRVGCNRVLRRVGSNRVLRRIGSCQLRCACNARSASGCLDSDDGGALVEEEKQFAGEFFDRETNQPLTSRPQTLVDLIAPAPTILTHPRRALLECSLGICLDSLQMGI